MTKIPKLKIIILFSIFYFVLSLQANAANLNLVSPVSEIGVSQEFQVDLFLDAEGQDINAAQGKIIFPENLFELKSINDGNSVITLWIQKPAYVKGEGIEFSGVVPGGFSGVLSPYYKGEKPGKVFSLVLEAKSEGYGSIEIKDAKVLLNDGQGTLADLKISNFQFLISKQAPVFQIPVAQTKDTDPPELFTPEISRDPSLFDNKWFLVFAAQDKGSGIDKYLIYELPRIKEQIATNEWIEAVSPYLLEDQKLRSYIYIKAIDKAGNSRIVYLPPTAPWYKKWPGYIILGLFGLVVLLLVIRWLWRKLKHRIIH